MLEHEWSLLDRKQFFVLFPYLQIENPKPPMHFQNPNLETLNRITKWFKTRFSIFVCQSTGNSEFNCHQRTKNKQEKVTLRLEGT